MKIELRKDGLVEINYTKGKRNFEKIATIQSFVESLISEQGLTTPLLPFGCRKYVRSGNQHIIYMEIPEMRRNIKYKNRDGKIIFEGIVPMPWGLMKLVFNEIPGGGYVFTKESNIWALERPLVGANDNLYFYPLPNIFERGAICWGSTFNEDDLKFEELSTAGRILDSYFSSNFNTDVAPRMNKYSRYEDLLRGIKDEAKFPKDVLALLGKVNGVL